ncbi:MAG: hypothetical protein AAF182_01695 [Pseudomonadota bacterium]
MTDSSLPNFPNPGTASVSSPSNVRAEEATVRLVDIPSRLDRVERTVRLRGEVVQQKAKNVVTVRTEAGDIDVQYPKEQQIPRNGQEVRIQLAKGNPPRSAVITPQKAPNAAQIGQNTASSAPESVNRVQNTPVDVELRHPKPDVATRLNQLQTPPSLAFDGIKQNAPVPVGENIQLQPITAKQAQAYIMQTALTLSLITGNIFQAVENIGNLLQPIALPEAQIQTLQAPLRTPVAPITQKTTLSAPQSLEILSVLAPIAAPESSVPRAASPKLSPVLEFLQANFTGATPKISQIPNVQTQAFTPNAQTTVPPQLQNAPVLSLDFASPTASDADARAQNPIPVSLDSTLSLKIDALEPFIARIESFQNTQPIVFTPEKTETILDVLKTLKAEQNSNTPRFFQSNQNIEQLSSSQNLNVFVTALTENNLPVVSFFPPEETQPQHFILHATAPDVVPGNSVQLAPLPGGVQNLSALFAPLNFTTLLEPGAWNTLQAIQQAITTQSPATAQMLGQVVPNATNAAQLTPAALFFVAAARGGDLNAWLGDKAIDALKRSERGNNLLNRLGQEGGLLSRASEGVSSDWRAIALPLYSQDEMHKMALYYRQEDGGEEQKKSGNGQTRFIFDLNLSQMGAVQLDGLFRPAYETPRLDLIVRTEQHFSQDMQAQMRRLYTKTIQNSQLDGELSFQNEPKSWVKVAIKEDLAETVVV